MWKQKINRLWHKVGGSAAWARRQAATRSQQVLNLLYPPHCAYCDADLLVSDRGLLLCERCGELLGPAVWEACRRCGAAVAEYAPIADDCRHCRGQRFWFDGVVALGPYRGELRDGVLRTKRRSGEVLAKVMGQLHGLRRGVGVEANRPDLVIPVPMHWRRHVSRRSNGVELAAGAIAGWLGLPLESQALRRRRNTRLQRNLSPRERFRNVRGAFEFRGGYDLRSTSVVLVDDVLTTGATASEAARVLKRNAGVALVTVAVLARATGEDR